MALEYELFNEEERRFLVGVDYADASSSPLLRWAEVELMHDWLIVGVDVKDRVLGPAPDKPEFSMLSLAGDLILRGTTWDEGIGFLVVPRPHDVTVIRSYVSRLADNPKTERNERIAAEEWLNQHPR